VQLSNYLKANPWASSKLIWTLDLDRTPIYALEAEPTIGMTWGDPVADESNRRSSIDGYFPPISYVHKVFHDAIVGQTLPATADNYVSRVSIPGVLTNRTVRLFSGQRVPVVAVTAHGLCSWKESLLVAALTTQLQKDREKRGAGIDQATVDLTVHSFLDKVYYHFRNLGHSSADRELNYVVTNVLMSTHEIRNGLLAGARVPRPAGQPEPLYTLDTIEVAKSPVCRMNSDCWDVRITFFDPEEVRRAKSVLLFTIDVSDVLPVSLAPTRQYLVGS
jgi:hypothetical protein